MKRIILLITTALMLCNYSMAQNKTVDEQFLKIRDVLTYISDYYVDTVNVEKLTNGAIRVALELLDPHSTYRSAKEMEDEKRKTDNNTPGIGATMLFFDDTLTIVKVAPNGPADRAGLRPGMQIDNINMVTVSDRLMKSASVNKIFQTFGNDSIEISYFKNKRSKTVKVKMEKSPAKTIESHYAPNDSSLYIKVSLFNKNTSADFDDVLNQYSKKKRRNIIIDLRDNPGGVLQPSIDICEHFLSENLLILSSRSANQKDTNYFSSDKGLLLKSRVYVLINENSASASEIIASCIQDWDRGVIIGRRSYGKGLTQQIINLDDGSQLRLTNSRLYAPSGRCLQKPFQKKANNAYFNEIATRKKRMEHICADSIKTAGAPQFHTILRHRTVYGNMGVVPDIFVPEDTTSMPQYWDSWIEKDVIDNYVYDNINSHRQYFESTYVNYKTFATDFFVSDQMLINLHTYIATDTTGCAKISMEEFEKLISTPELNAIMKNYIKSRYAYGLYGANESRQTINGSDADYKEALRLINSPEAYYEVLSARK